MRPSNEHFINMSDDQNNGVDLSLESVDPLHGLGFESTEPGYHRIDNIVFAEPLRNITNEENISKGDQEKQDKIMFIDSVIIQEKIGKKYRKYHINIEDGSQLKCSQPNCNRTYSTTKLLKAHIRKVHCADRNRYICEQCGRGFSALYLLERHRIVHSGKKVECPICGVMLSGRTSLSAHLNCHSAARSHQCELCHKSFTRPSTLKTHAKFVHREGSLECNQCEMRFGTRKQWSQHVTSHRTNKPDIGTSQET